MHKHLQLHSYFHFSQITQMYVGIALRSFAISLIGIFLPLILLENGYSFADVLIYYVYFTVFAFVFFLIGVELMQFIGIKHVMLLNVPFLFFFFYLIFSITTFHWPLLLMAIFHAASSAFFWSAFHIEFAAASSKKRSGRQIGLINIMTQSLSLVSPLIGGVMIIFYGEAGIAILSASISALSAIPLLITKDHKVKAPFKTSDLFHQFSARRMIAFTSEGVRNFSALVIWPTYITVVGLGALAIGSLYTVVRIVIILSSFVVGKLSDKFEPRHIVRFGTVFHSVSLAMRGFMTTAGAFTAITSFGGFGFITFNVPLQKMWYGAAKKLGPLFVIRREFYLDLGRLLLLTLALLLYGLTQSIFVTSIVCFFLGAIATLLINFVE